MISFKGVHYLKETILYAVFFCVRYAVSYRDLEEIMLERGINAGQATLNRWVVKYAPIMIETARNKRKITSASWRVDEAYIKIKGS
jgi:putative transposase